MSKLESLMREHLKKQQSARAAHAAKVESVRGKIAQNIKIEQDAVLERNKASDAFHESTELTGLAFVEALATLHEGITAATEAKLVTVPDASVYGAELAATLEQLDQDFETSRVKIELEESAATSAAALIVPPTSPIEQAADALADTANDGIFQVLTKVGAKPDDLEAVLGVQSAEARRATRAAKSKSNDAAAANLRKVAQA